MSKSWKSLIRFVFIIRTHASMPTSTEGFMKASIYSQMSIYRIKFVVSTTYNRVPTFLEGLFRQTLFRPQVKQNIANLTYTNLYCFFPCPNHDWGS